MQFDIRRLDIYRKVPKDLTQPTYTGATISVCCLLAMAYLILNEFFAFLTPSVSSTLIVDDPDEANKISVFLNMTLPELSCDLIGLDIQDDMGRHEVGYVENTTKTALGDGVGCLFEATFQLTKVPGNFHISTHAAGNRMAGMPSFRHHIHALHLGDAVDVGGSFNRLRDVNHTDSPSDHTHEYVVRVVPTVFQSARHLPIYSYQYVYAYKSVRSARGGRQMVPAIWFKYDISPIAVIHTETSVPFYHFFTYFCAIIGGVFTVAGIIDSLVFTASETFRKIQLGKIS